MKRGYLSKITYKEGLWITGLLLLFVSVLVNLLFIQKTTDSILASERLRLLPGMGANIPWLQSVSDNVYIQHGLFFIVILGIALLLQFLTSKHRLIRVRSFFPFFLYCLLASVLFPYIRPLGSLLASFILTWSCIRLFSVTENKDVNRAIFDASFLLSLASLSMIRLVWLLPALWVIIGMIHAFSFRNLLSSLIGLLSCYWIIGGFSLLFEDYRFLTNWTVESMQFSLIDMASLSLVAILFLSLVGLLMLMAVGSFIKNQHHDKLQTRNLMGGILVLWVAMVALWLTAGSGHTSLLIVLFCPTTLFLAHYFSLTDTLFSRFLFIILVALSPITFFFFQ